MLKPTLSGNTGNLNFRYHICLAIFAKDFPGIIICQWVAITVIPLFTWFISGIDQFKVRLGTKYNAIYIKSGASVFTLPMLKHISAQINKFTVCNQGSGIITVQPESHGLNLFRLKLPAFVD